MKKFFLLLAAFVAMFTTSCISEVTSDAQLQVNECDVTFSLSTTQALGSRAETIGKGFKATNLTYAIYDQDWKWLKTEHTTFENGSLSKTLTLRLVKGKVYNFVFWAQSPSATCYTLDLESDGVKPSVSVNYSAPVANDDHRDAFFGQLTNLTADGNVNETVDLKRPFAQVNFGTTEEDVTAAKEMGFDITNATTKFVARTYTKFFLDNGNVDDTTLQRVEFTAAALPGTDNADDKTLHTLTKGDYRYLAMNYLLWLPSENALEECTMTISVPGQTDIEVKVPNAPARRNWRTNLVGSLLTEEGSLVVEIKPTPEGDLPQ